MEIGFKLLNLFSWFGHIILKLYMRQLKCINFKSEKMVFCKWYANLLDLFNHFSFKACSPVNGYQITSFWLMSINFVISRFTHLLLDLSFRPWKEMY